MKKISYFILSLLIICSIKIHAQAGKGLVTYAKNGVAKFIEFDNYFLPNSTNPQQVLATNLNLGASDSYTKISEIIDKL